MESGQCSRAIEDDVDEIWAKLVPNDSRYQEIEIRSQDTIICSEVTDSSTEKLEWCEISSTSDHDSARIRNLSANKIIVDGIATGEEAVDIKSGSEITSGPHKQGFLSYTFEVIPTQKHERKSLKISLDVEHAKCSICLNIWHDVVTVAPCLHNFCNGCFSELLRRSSTRSHHKHESVLCPQCRTIVHSVGRNHFLHNIEEVILETFPSLKCSDEEIARLDACASVKSNLVLEIKKQTSRKRPMSSARDEVSVVEFPCPQCGTELGGFRCSRGTTHLQCQGCGGLMPSRPDIGVPQHCLGCNRAFCCAYWRSQGVDANEYNIICNQQMLRPISERTISRIPDSTHQNNQFEKDITERCVEQTGKTLQAVISEWTIKFNNREIGKNYNFADMAHRKSAEKEMDIGWSYGKMVDNNHRYAECNFCKKKMHGGVTRLKEHISGIGSDVASCKEAPKEVKEKIKAHLLEKKKEKQAGKLEKQRVQEELMRKPQHLDPEGDSEDDEEQADLVRTARASRESFIEDEIYRRNKGIGEGSKLSFRSRSVHVQGEVDFGTRNVPNIDSFMQKKGGKSQSSIRTAMKGIKDAKKHIGRAISKIFFYNHIPHNVANSPYYETMVDAIADAGRGVKPPTAWEISNTYLDAEHEEIEEYMKQHEKYWDEYGCTLMCDGWSTQNRRKIINFLVYSTYGTVFIDSIDATDEFQSADYICSLMDDMVERIGEQRVVQVVTDNGANYKAAGHLLMDKRKHLYWTPCAAHCIDLILEDMAKEEEVKNVIGQCQKITGYIYNHGWLLSMMRKETGQKELIRPAITRFATHFIALNSIYVHRDNLKRMVLSRGWIDKIPRLTAKERTVAFRVQMMIQNETFWNDIACVIIVFEPLVKVLRMVDSDDRAEMGYLYEAMDRAKESIRHNIGRGYKKWWNIIDKRWDKQLHRDIHAAGYFLNPTIQYSDNVENDNEVLAGFRHVVGRLEPDVFKQLDIDREVEFFRMKVGIFSSEKAKIASKKLNPAEWWSIIAREKAPNLTRIAMRVLSQTVSSSNCERNWTTFSLIHTKTRNRLTMNNLKKLVYVHYNMRLRERNIKRKNNDNEIIDLDHIFHEDDPLAEWTCEVEDRLLDDRDNSWLDEALHEAPAIDRGRQSHRGDKRKKPQISEDSEHSDSPDDHGGSSNIGGGGVGATGVCSDVYGSGSGDFSGGGGYGSVGGSGSGSGGRFGGNVYQRGYGRDYHPAMRESELHESYDQQYGFQDSYDPSSTSETQPSPYDNLMVSFFGPSQMQYSYPSHYDTMQEGDDNAQSSFEPHRSSFWW